MDPTLRKSHRRVAGRRARVGYQGTQQLVGRACAVMLLFWWAGPHGLICPFISWDAWLRTLYSVPRGATVPIYSIGPARQKLQALIGLRLGSRVGGFKALQHLRYMLAVAWQWMAGSWRACVQRRAALCCPMYGTATCSEVARRLSSSSLLLPQAPTSQHVSGLFTRQRVAAILFPSPSRLTFVQCMPVFCLF